MLMSELRDLLDHKIRTFGDLLIVGGYITDDTSPRRVTILNESDDAVAAYLE